MRNVIFLLLLSILIGCKESDSTATVITNEFKLEFLNEVFSDTVDIQILHSKSELISNFGKGYTVPFTWGNSEMDFIISHLKESDTLFIQKQLESSSKLHLDSLSNYGFRILDEKGMSKAKFSHNDILQVADSINQKTGNYSFLKFTIPVFNKEKNLAYMSLQKGSTSEAIILEKNGHRWKRKIQLYELTE